MMKIKKIFVLLIMFILILCGCENKEETKMPKEDPIITMNIKDFGTIKIELYPKIAFNTDYIIELNNEFYECYLCEDSDKFSNYLYLQKVTL